MNSNGTSISAEASIGPLVVVREGHVPGEGLTGDINVADAIALARSG